MNTILFKWNPEVSWLTFHDYMRLLAMNNDACIQWCFRDYERARKGDRMYFIRTGEKTQLLASGYLLSDPEAGIDNPDEHGVELDFDFTCHPDYAWALTASDLEKVLPGVDFGEDAESIYLTEAQAEALEIFWTDYLFQHREDIYRKDGVERLYAVDQRVPELEDKMEKEEVVRERYRKRIESMVADRTASIHGKKKALWTEEDYLAAYQEEEKDDPLVYWVADPYPGIVGLSGQSFEDAYGEPERAEKNRVLQRYFLRTRGASCQVCGYSFQKVFGEACGKKPVFFEVKKDADRWDRSFVSVCPSCRKVLEEDPDLFLKKV